eukprot:CAMPEP_0195005256 /NCGR_PEP_ID=MMETSP0326_2-20130528/5466_1 /TAXON_ID=2866 ORGANISM="Crypthecodinium cohnii, Strain Seligo" /NCGR_SAMPLE_ID=MMETSP0326_2 /ASSEMBLY_ACC=CAM_ASM_000348 /LENGTH=37 /DNA_ID= /DNA_START= /DNA_END= /DNA_ORIENTATION=
MEAGAGSRDEGKCDIAGGADRARFRPKTRGAELIKSP